jgi:hypothetical protein
MKTVFGLMSAKTIIALTLKKNAKSVKQFRLFGAKIMTSLHGHMKQIFPTQSLIFTKIRSCGVLALYLNLKL